MSENSKIEWTDHTFNPWIGCAKVSDGCKHCYAETLMDKRYNRVTWGPQGTRSRTSDANWKKPLAWNKQAWEECADCGWRGPHSDTHDFCPDCEGENLQSTRQRVFCASLADVFEDRPELHFWREDLLSLITETPNLDWLLLTKRPENINEMFDYITGPYRLFWEDFPNLWIGTSVENQETADNRIPELLKVPARVRFLSMEPLLGEVMLWPWLPISGAETSAGGIDWKYDRIKAEYKPHLISAISWVIVGGESGHNARPMHPDWARSIRDQCVAAGIAFHFKQWGEWLPVSRDTPMPLGNKSLSAQVGKTWGGLRADGTMLKPEDSIDQASAWVWRAGKAAASRLLDGRTWDEYPAVQP